MTQKPHWWNNLHDSAMKELTNEWQAYSKIKSKTGLFLTAFNDLCVAGFAEQKLEGIFIGSNLAGHRIYLRLKEPREKKYKED